MNAVSLWWPSCGARSIWPIGGYILGLGSLIYFVHTPPPWWSHLGWWWLPQSVQFSSFLFFHSLFFVADIGLRLQQHLFVLLNGLPVPGASADAVHGCFGLLALLLEFIGGHLIVLSECLEVFGFSFGGYFFELYPHLCVIS